MQHACKQERKAKQWQWGTGWAPKPLDIITHKLCTSFDSNGRTMVSARDTPY